MLLLARKAGQSVVIDGNIRVTVDRIRGRVVRLKVEAPTEIRVDREEVWNRRAGEDQREVLAATQTRHRPCLFDS
jgi:carbon storage regulator